MEEVGKDERMKGRNIKEMGGSSRGMYIRNIADIIPNWSYIRSTADITKLSKILNLAILISLLNNYYYIVQIKGICLLLFRGV